MSPLIYYKHAGRIHGPIEASQIRKLAQLGQTQPNDQWSVDGISWSPIESLDSHSPLPPPTPVASFDTWPTETENVPPPVSKIQTGAPGRIPAPNTNSNPDSPSRPIPVKGLIMGGSIVLGLVLLLTLIRFLNPGTQKPPVDEFAPQGGQIPKANGDPGEGQAKGAQPANGRPGSKEFLEKQGKSVALIRRATDTGQVIGSGFLFKAGYLMTTADIAGDDRGILISVVFPAGDADERGPHQARIHHHDPATGIAILRLDAPQLPIPLSDAGLLKAGEDLFVLASPGFSAPREPMNLELVNASYLTTTTKKDLEFHRISARTKPSQGGAPLLDTRGNAVGMIASPITPEDPLCITSRQILKILKDVNLP